MIDSKQPSTLRTASAVALAVCLACASRGDRFNVDAVPKIILGYTTMVEVKELFGEPNTVRVWGSGGAEWGYVYEEETRRDTRLITKIGRSIASIFGVHTYYPPVDIAYSNKTRDTLEVIFDHDGIVIDYTYEHKEVPTHKVY